MGFTKEQSETLRKLAAAKDVYEFVAVLDVSFPIWPGNLDLAKFVKYKTNSLKVSFEGGFGNNSSNFSGIRLQEGRHPNAHAMVSTAGSIPQDQRKHHGRIF
jgi:hypothetical protein